MGASRCRHHGHDLRRAEEMAGVRMDDRGRVSVDRLQSPDWSAWIHPRIDRIHDGLCSQRKPMEEE